MFTERHSKIQSLAHDSLTQGHVWTSSDGYEYGTWMMQILPLSDLLNGHICNLGIRTSCESTLTAKHERPSKMEVDDSKPFNNVNHHRQWLAF